MSPKCNERPNAMSFHCSLVNMNVMRGRGRNVRLELMAHERPLELLFCMILYGIYEL